MTYLDDIQGDAILGDQDIEVAPALGKARLAKGTLLHLAHVDNEGNIVLLGNREALAAHRRSDDSLTQTMSKVDLVTLVANVAHEDAEEIAGGLVHGMTLLNSDVALHLPRELGQGANEALERTLRALLRKGRLQNS